MDKIDQHDSTAAVNRKAVIDVTDDTEGIHVGIHYNVHQMSNKKRLHSSWKQSADNNS